MADMYTDIERSIQQKLVQAIQPLKNGMIVKVFNNQVTKKDYPNAHGAISIMKVSDVFQPANGGGTKAIIRTPMKVDGVIASYDVQDWPDPFDLMYALEVSADTTNGTALVGDVRLSGLEIVRYCDNLIRTVFRPRKRMLIWDSDAKGGQGDWSCNYTNYAYAGYINRDNVSEEIYNRVTNIRFEAFNYQPQVNEGAITQPIQLDIETTPQD